MLYAPVAHIFEHTGTQYETLERLLVIYGGSLPIVGVSTVLGVFCLFKERVKVLMAADVISYILYLLDFI